MATAVGANRHFPASAPRRIPVERARAAAVCSGGFERVCLASPWELERSLKQYRIKTDANDVIDALLRMLQAG